MCGISQIENHSSVTSTTVNDTPADLIYEGTLEPPKGKLPEDWEEREQTLLPARARSAEE